MRHFVQHKAVIQQRKNYLEQAKSRPRSCLSAFYFGRDPARPGDGDKDDAINSPCFPKKAIEEEKKLDSGKLGLVDCRNMSAVKPRSVQVIRNFPSFGRKQQNPPQQNLEDSECQAEVNLKDIELNKKPELIAEGPQEE